MILQVLRLTMSLAEAAPQVFGGLMRQVFSGEEGTSILDALEYLPCSTIERFRRGQVIYREGQGPAHLYVILSGSVKLFRVAGGQPVMMNIYGPEEIFGESALLRVPDVDERAVAWADTEVMSWTAAAVEGVIMRKPQLGIALGQILAQRLVSIGRRLTGMASVHTAPRSPGRPARRVVRDPDQPFEERPLTAREREVVALIAQGLTNREIAARLFIGQQTVKNHVHSIFGKLGISDRLQLTLYNNTPSPAASSAGGESDYDDALNFAGSARELQLTS